ncbi:hypothetical protein ACFL21_03070 [Patescibacteria group bacterium]
MAGCKRKNIEGYRERLSEIFDTHEVRGELRMELRGFFDELVGGIHGPKLQADIPDFFEEIQRDAANRIAEIHQDVTEVELLKTKLIESVKSKLFPRIEMTEIESNVRDLFSKDLEKKRSAYEYLIRLLRRVGVNFKQRIEIFNDYFSLILEFPDEENGIYYANTESDTDSIPPFDFARALEDPRLIFLDPNDPIGRHLCNNDFSILSFNFLKNAICIGTIEILERIFTSLRASGAELPIDKLYFVPQEYIYFDRLQELLTGPETANFSELILGLPVSYGYQHLDVFFEHVGPELYQLLLSQNSFPNLKKLEIVIDGNETGKILNYIVNSNILDKVDELRLHFTIESRPNFPLNIEEFINEKLRENETVKMIERDLGFSVLVSRDILGSNDILFGLIEITITRNNLKNSK